MKLFALLFTIFALVSAAVAVTKVECKLEPGVEGSCRNYYPMWTYNKATNKCKAFYYGGCGGNANRFYSSEDCEDACIIELNNLNSNEKVSILAIDKME